MTFAVCNFIRLKVPGGEYTQHSYQNFFVNESKTYGSTSYKFLPFGITNGAGKKGGDRSSTSLVLSPNAITINVLAEATDLTYLLEVKTVEVEPLTMSVGALITSELWAVGRMEFDTEKAILQLSSPLDAVDAQVPRRYLSSVLVGGIPTTGRLSMG